MLPLSHWRENSKGGAERVKGSAASRVLRKPNAYQTKSDFFLNLVRAELMRGNGYALATRNGRQEIDSLHLMQPSSMYPFIDEEANIYYQFSAVPIGINFDPVINDMFRASDVLHIRMHTPVHPLVGETPLLAAAMAVDSGNAIQRASAAFHENMSRPSGYLKVPGKLDSEVAETLRGEWQAAYSGVSAGRIAVLQGGVEWTALSMTAVDAAIIESYKMSVADIARVFRTPLAIIGESTQTYNNTEVLMKFWLSTGLGFLLEHIELALDALFQLPEGEWIAFDTDYLQRADFAARIEGLVKGIAGGLFSPNEARAREGLPSTNDGDEPRLQAQVVPLSFAYKTPEPAAPTVPVGKTPVAEDPKVDPKKDPPPADVKQADIFQWAEVQEGTAKFKELVS